MLKRFLHLDDVGIVMEGIGRIPARARGDRDPCGRRQRQGTIEMSGAVKRAAQFGVFNRYEVMKRRVEVAAEVREDLTAVYDEIMWLAKRRGVTPSDARAWYTHIRAVRLRRSVRRFSGKISARAARARSTPLRLEHYKRLQTNLTRLVQRHIAERVRDSREFVRMVLDCERVHIVTFKENYDALRANGNYRNAGIRLLDWRSLPEARRALLWRTLLRGKVANAERFAPRGRKIGRS